ncbi:exopolysaccharide biosynthesis polyprenyl glycosylphosphotransferase [Candidatus Parcubacteria bacterium]|nr:exopolysaccharide biosynthesis polyprenyl glycosylphosphotransferase [Candidatus Parcubacteria bacterium]
MTHVSKKEATALFLGDIVFFIISLWIMLVIRYGELPNHEVISLHLIPFSILFCVWIMVFFVAGLYEKHTVILKNKLPTIILNAQIVNSVIAVLFFYFIPYFGITPKTNLFLYLIISFALILMWRIYGHAILGASRKEKAILIGTGQEVQELKEEVNNNSRYNLKFVTSLDLDHMESLDFQEEIVKRIYAEDISVIAIDLNNKKVEPILPHLYNLIYSKVRFVDMYKIYEDIFDRVPLSLLKYNWFLENISIQPHTIYDLLKRIMDVVLSVILGALSLVAYPFVYAAIKMDDGGALFSFQERVGQNNKLIRIFKFRTMSKANDGGKWGADTDNVVTRVGKVLRATRIDELPQLWNVLLGDISLIGPRPEFKQAVKQYEQEIPYFSVRHLIKPGLSGWAQIYGEHAHHGVDLDKTKNKLSYDLYYLKNRSFLLDIKIALRTMKTFMSRSGV